MKTNERRSREKSAISASRSDVKKVEPEEKKKKKKEMLNVRAQFSLAHDPQKSRWKKKICARKMLKTAVYFSPRNNSIKELNPFMTSPQWPFFRLRFSSLFQQLAQLNLRRAHSVEFRYLWRTDVKLFFTFCRVFRCVFFFRLSLFY